MRRISKRAAVFMSSLGLTLGWMNSAAADPARNAGAEPSADADLQAYYSGNGLLNRGMFDLAVAEYRTFLAAHGKHEKAPMARYGLAVSLFRLGKLDDAAPELTRLRSRKPFAYAAEVATLLGQCHLAHHRYKEAVEAFEAVLQEHADHTLADDAAAQLVEALYRNEALEDAAARCKLFASRWPDSPQRDRADYFGGLAEMGRHAYARAAERFEHLLDQRPDGPFAGHATLLLARCYHRDGDAKAAQRGYRRVLKSADDPYRPDALLGLATLLYEQKKTQRAGPFLDELLKKYPDSPLVGSARLLRGRVWFDSQDYDSAAGAFNEAAKARGSVSAEAAYWSAKCKLRRNDFDAAARSLKEAIAKYPDSPLLPEMVYDRAIALMRGGDDKAAEKALEAFRSRFPEHALAPDALRLLAATAHWNRAYDRSLRYARTFLKAYPDHELAAQMAFLLADNEYLAGRYEPAAAGYRRFLDRYGDNPKANTARYRLGMALYRLDKLDDARQLLADIDTTGAEAAAFHAAHLALGDIHFRRGEWKPAARHLKLYLAKGLGVAGADDALLKLGLALQRQGRHAEAIPQYDRLLERFAKSPHRLQAVFERGQALVALQRLDEAVTAFEEVLAEGEDTRFAAAAERHLATIAVHRGDWAGAADRFARVARATKGSDKEAEALFQRGQALLRAREFEAAGKALTRLLDRFDAHPRLPAARANLAIALSRLDRHEDALKWIEQVDPSALAPALAASLQYEKAWCLRALGKDDDAAVAYRRVIESNADAGLRAHALLELADIEAGAGQHEEAVKHLKRLRHVIGQTEKDILPSLGRQAAYRLGTSLFRLEKYEEAADVLGAFVKQCHDEKLLISASFFRGEALYKLGKHDRAIKPFERVLGGAKTDSAYAPSLLRLGECYAVHQRWAKSEEVFTEYLERFETGEQWFQAQFGVGWARENQRRFDEAIDAYQQVVARHKGETAARAQFQIGQCLFALKRYEDAARELVKVDILYAYPQWSAAALYEAGRCFESLSRTAEARKQFKEVIDKYKDTQWAELASERLTAATAGLPPGQ